VLTPYTKVRYHHDGFIHYNPANFTQEMHMRSRRVFIILGVLLAILIVPMLVMPDAPESAYYRDIKRPLVIAHQGGDGIRPGDTMVAFEHAVQIGADVLEMDAHITQDGKIVLMHDERVDRTTDGTGLTEDMTLEELRQLDAAYQWSNDDDKTFPYRGQGIHVPTLEELFQKFPDMRYVIEIKLTQNPIDKPLCDLIRKYNMQNRVMIASFHDEAMQRFRETCPEVATSASRGEVTKFVLLGKIFLSGLIAPQYESIQPPYDPEESMNIPIMTKRFIREAHARNIAVEPWTVDDPELMKKYIEWGVDGIITDRPDLMLEVLGK
jgi:glycerophosphoryl diester phosphodiesterase